jgi:bifunctional DNA-binding transcriptional regulator/antitoxin component of YhaV-PrlF toxin-antitoxin module
MAVDKPVRKFIRVRERNQITLPQEILSGTPINVGDFLEITRTDDGLIHLKPTVLVIAHSPEAQREEAHADDDIANERYKTFDTAAELMGDVESKRKRRRKTAAVAASAAR